MSSPEQKRKRVSSSEDSAGSDDGGKRDAHISASRPEVVREDDARISYKSSEEIIKSIRTTNPDLLVQGFTHFREHLRLCTRKPRRQETAEERALRESNKRVVFEWAEQPESFADLSSAWHLATTNAVARLDGLVPVTMASLLEVFDTPSTSRHGNKLIGMVMEGFMKTIYRAFSTPRSFACAAVLQLLTQMVVFANGEHADEIRMAFDWTIKTLGQLPFIRAQGTGTGIRMLWIRFVMSFFAAERCTGAKELLRSGNLIHDLFKGVEQDSYSELSEFLHKIYTGIVTSDEIRRSDKISLFGTRVVEMIMRAADNHEVVELRRVGVSQMELFVPEATDADLRPQSDSISDLIIRFISGLMTHPGVGICFKEYGLYPAPRKWVGDSGEKDNSGAGADDDEDIQDVAVLSRGSSSQLQYLCNGAILRILVQRINPSQSKQRTDLAVSILRASPELIAPFWRNITCSFEPRLSLRYLGNTTLALKVLGLPLPIPKEGDLQRHGPPRLNTLVEHVAPFPLTRQIVGRGLQHKGSALVRYRNLLIIDLALRKLAMARAWIQGEAKMSESSEKWRVFEKQLLAAVKQRIPEWKVVISAHQEILSKATAITSADEDLREIECQQALMSNVLMRIVHGYQEHFNELIIESRFEIGKLIADIDLAEVVSTGAAGRTKVRNPMGAHTLLYLLQVLATTPATHIKWTAKTSGSSAQHTNLGVILNIHLFAVQPELRRTARTVCTNALMSSGLFDHEQGCHAAFREVNCWLDALAALTSPQADRNVRLGHVLQNDLERGQTLISFLEDAVEKAARLPYKYVDQIQALTSADTLPFSPLLPAVVEAALLKASSGNGPLVNKLKDASAGMATAELCVNQMFTFIRELVSRIAELKGSGTAKQLKSFVEGCAKQLFDAKLAKDGAKADKAHYDKTTEAFAASSSAVVTYLSAIKSQKGKKSKTDKIPKKLGKDLAAACTEMDFASTSDILDKLAKVLRSHADSANPQMVTRWLVEETAAMSVEDMQMALAVVAVWVANCDSQNASLWSYSGFATLVPPLLKLDNAQVRLALFRSLLLSTSFGDMVNEDMAKQLLTTLLVASNGTAEFCTYAIMLVNWSANTPDTLAFVFGLVTAHATSHGTEPFVLEWYAETLSPSTISGDSEVQKAYDFYVCKLARKSAKGYKAAGRVWHELTRRVAESVSASMEKPSEHSLLLLRTVAPVVDSNTCVDMATALGVVIESESTDTSLLPSLISTTYVLIDSHPASSSNLTSVKERLSMRIIDLWTSSLSEHGDGSQKASRLVHTVKQVTALPGFLMGSVPSRLVDGIVQAKTALVHFDQRYSAGGKAVDVLAVVRNLWQRADIGGAFEEDASKREILARLLAADGQLRKTVWPWVAENMQVGGSSQKTWLLVWLLMNLAKACSAQDSYGRIVWDKTDMADGIKAKLLVAASLIDPHTLANDSELAFALSAAIQGSNDSAIADALYEETAENRALALRSKLLRVHEYPTELSAHFTALADVVSLGRELASQGEFASMAVLASASEFSLRFQLDHFTKSDAMDVDVSLDDAEVAKNAVASLFNGLDLFIGEVCAPFAIASRWSEAQVQAASTKYPAPVYKLLAFVAQTTQTITESYQLAPDPELKWFDALKQILNCRCFIARMQDGPMRDSLAMLISALWNLTKPSLSRWSASLDDYLCLDELESLVGAYGGSRLLADRILLKVIGEYEATTRQSVMRALLLFGPSAAKTYIRDRVGRIAYLIDRNENDVGTVDEDVIARAIINIDSGKLFRSVLNFPVEQTVENSPVEQMLAVQFGTAVETDREQLGQVYDHTFLLMWIWSIVASGHRFDIRRLFDINAAGLVFVALSSADQKTRKLAYFILDALYPTIANAQRLGGQRQYLLLFDSLRNAITDRTQWEYPHVPLTMTLFAASSLNVLMHPDHIMFGHVNKHLLAKPYLSSDEIPLLRSAMKSTTNTKRERVHILRLAAQSARSLEGSSDAFRRASVANILFTLASNPLGDVLTSRAAMTMAFNLTGRQNSEGLLQHVSKRRPSLLTWIRLQVELQLNVLLGAASLVKTEGAVGNAFVATQQMHAALINLLAFARLSARIVGNFSLSGDGSDFSRFWVVKSQDQANASGQTIIISMVQEMLHGVARALAMVGELNPGAVKTALALVSTSVDVAVIMSDMQAFAGGKSVVLESSQITSLALQALKALEPAIAQTDATCIKESGSIETTILSQFSESLFIGCADPMSGYRACIDSVLAWTCSVGKGSPEVVSRVLASGAPSSTKVVSWIRRTD